MSHGDLDELFGGPPKKKLGRPSKADIAARAAAGAVEDAIVKADLPSDHVFYRPVGVTFLASVFRMEVKTAHKKLRRCPVMEWGTHKGKDVPLFDFVVAAQYLVTPKVDLNDYLSSLNSNNIPPHLNKMFWDANLAKQRWQVKAGQLWHDEDVLAVLGSVAMIIKDRVTLWIENLPGRENITSAQYETLTANAAGLLDEITIQLVDSPKRRSTQSTVTDLDAELDKSSAAVLGDVDDGDED